jgi:hypothetical protein
VKDADKLRRRATECRDLAAEAKDKFVRKELLMISEEFEEAAFKLELDEACQVRRRAQ